MSFERSGGSTRSFDISVLTNNDIGYTFSSIEKNEYQKLYDYFKNKKITVKAQGSGGKGGTLNFDEDDKVDHYLEGKNTVTYDQNYGHSSEEQHIVPTFRLSPFQALSPFIRITPQKNCPHSLDFKLVPVY